MTPEERKQAVVAVLEIAFNPGRPAAEKRRLAAEVINPDKYIQHSAGVPDGFEGLMGLVADLDANFDDYGVQVHKVICEDDLVFALCHYRFGRDDVRGKAIAELFRFEDGLIVEHWDVIQDIPEQRANANPMF